MSYSLPKSVFNKAHDIAFAVFRVAAIVKNMKLRVALEGGAVDLINDLNAGAVDKLGALVKLAASINEIKPINAEILEKELTALNCVIQSAITESVIGNDEEVNLKEAFADNEGKNEKLSQLVVSPPNPHIINRQSAIIEFIRQLPDGCRMRDLTAKFGDVSERTIRNDLQNLTAEGLIERVGSQGPFGSFRAVTKKEIIAL